MAAEIARRVVVERSGLHQRTGRRTARVAGREAAGGRVAGERVHSIVDPTRPGAVGRVAAARPGVAGAFQEGDGTGVAAHLASPFSRARAAGGGGRSEPSRQLRRVASGDRPRRPRGPAARADDHPVAGSTERNRHPRAPGRQIGLAGQERRAGRIGEENSGPRPFGDCVRRIFDRRTGERGGGAGAETVRPLFLRVQPYRFAGAGAGLRDGLRLRANTQQKPPDRSLRRWARGPLGVIGCAGGGCRCRRLRLAGFER